MRKNAVFTPGYWTGTGRAEVVSAADYQVRDLEELLEVTVPPAKRHKDGRLVRRRVPRPPEGRVVAVKGTRRRDIYPAASAAPEALAALAKLTHIAGWRGPALRQVADAYWEASGSGRASNLKQLLTTSSERPGVEEAARDFVKGFGPLVRCFGQWCVEAQSTLFAERYASRWLGEAVDLMQRIGREHLLWSPDWTQWAEAVYRAGQKRPHLSKPLPAPLTFHIWAALMLSALREHPEWPGCHLFFTNRLAAMRLVSGVGWSTHMLAEFTPQELRRAAVVVDGSLLDYLGAAAGCHSWGVNMGTCANCSALFDARDGRRHYCQDCSNKQTRDRLAARRRRAEERSRRERERRAEKRPRT
jgi:hypothetical protein